MKVLDDIKAQMPMDKISEMLLMARGKFPNRKAKVYPGLSEAKQIVKRAHFFLEENSSITLGKQDIYKREIKNDGGSSKTFTYTVDFANPQQIKRLRNFLTELVDLTAEDASSAKKESIPGFLDYMAEASI